MYRSLGIIRQVTPYIPDPEMASDATGDQWDNAILLGMQLETADELECLNNNTVTMGKKQNITNA